MDISFLSLPPPASQIVVSCCFFSTWGWEWNTEARFGLIFCLENCVKRLKSALTSLINRSQSTAFSLYYCLKYWALLLYSKMKIYSICRKLYASMGKSHGRRVSYCEFFRSSQVDGSETSKSPRGLAVWDTYHFWHLFFTHFPGLFPYFLVIFSLPLLVFGPQPRDLLATRESLHVGREDVVAHLWPERGRTL